MGRGAPGRTYGLRPAGRPGARAVAFSAAGSVEYSAAANTPPAGDLSLNATRRAAGPPPKPRQISREHNHESALGIDLRPETSQRGRLGPRLVATTIRSSLWRASACGCMMLRCWWLRVGGSAHDWAEGGGMYRLQTPSVRRDAGRKTCQAELDHAPGARVRLTAAGRDSAPTPATQNGRTGTVRGPGPAAAVFAGTVGEYRPSRPGCAHRPF